MGQFDGQRNPAAMLSALHKADPRTLNKRYNPKQLQAAFAALQAKKGGGNVNPDGSTNTDIGAGSDPNSMVLDTGDFTDERTRIEDALYGNLTRNTDADYSKERGQLEQTLYGRGINLSEADPTYKAAMSELTRRYDDIKNNARANATVLGGQEFDRYFGANMANKQIGLSQEELKLKRRQINAAIEQMGRRGGPAAPPADSAFSSSAPPGL